MPLTAHFAEPAIDQQKPRAPRRRILLEGRGLLETGADTPVTVHNVSATGLLIEAKAEIEIDEKLDLVLPGEDALPAHVVWASGNLYGCAFDEPLSPALLSALELRSAVQAEMGLAAAPIPAGPAAVGGESLGERLHRLRKLRGLTQGELAARLGVSKPTVWAWEQDRARPIEDRIEAIAEALGVTVAELRPGRTVPGLSELITRCRGQIASALETTPEKVRIMIEL